MLGAGSFLSLFPHPPLPIPEGTLKPGVAILSAQCCVPTMVPVLLPFCGIRTVSVIQGLLLLPYRCYFSYLLALLCFTFKNYVGFVLSKDGTAVITF